jgi:protein-S-isoprenylcysteine O-methyltransferase Ste14
MLPFGGNTMVPSDGPRSLKLQSRRLSAILGSLVFLVVAPGMLAGLGPWWLTRWEVRDTTLANLPVQALGWLLIALGLYVLLESFARFALQGFGTPAPVFPTRKLIVEGFYRFTRNPIYLAVEFIIFGQGLVFGDIRLFLYGVAFWIPCHLFVLFYEEPTLRRTFGTEYEAYTANVPRWLPRLTRWRGRVESQNDTKRYMS